jgi:hypothetical protein
VEVLITAQGAEQAGELESLRAWFDDASGDGAPWVMTPVPADDSTLGLGVEGICAVITTADALVRLVERIANWRESRQEPPPVTLTMTIGSVRAVPVPVREDGTAPEGGSVRAVPVPASEDGAGQEGGANSRHVDEPDT